jgi:FKBP12-rapamycin complex-associated protein
MDRVRGSLPDGEPEKVTIVELVDEFAKAASSESGRGEANKVLAQIRAQLYSRLNTTSSSEQKVEVVEVSGKLVDLLNAENGSVMVPVLANVLRTALADSTSYDVIKAASVLLGRLASKRGFLVISETVSFELKRALEWLPDSYEFRRLASVLVLSELAVAVPAAVFQQMDRYLSVMWTALCDNMHRPIFAAAATTLHRMLEIVLQRGSSQQTLQVFSRVLDEALAKLAKSPMTHGALLAIGELFGLEAVRGDAGVFALLVAKFPLCCEAVLKLRSSKDKRISKTVLKLIPRLAHFNPAHFSTHLAKVVKHLISLMRKPGPFTPLTISVIGDIAVAIGMPDILPHLPNFVQVIVPLIRVEMRQGKSFLPYPGALLCIGLLTEAGGETMATLIERDGLLDRMFECGLFPELVQAATRIVSVCPLHIAEKAERGLLHVLSLVICDVPFRPIGCPTADTVSATMAKRVRLQVAEQGMALKIMALSTLCAFPFRGPLVHMAEKVLRYLDSKFVALKMEALSCALHLLLTDTENSVPKLAAGVALRVVARVLLLGTTDQDPQVRLACITKLAEANRFDTFICHPDNLKLLLLLCYDERLEIRTLAVRVFGNLHRLTPGFVRPAMRKMLVQYLRALELTASPPSDQSQPALVMASFVRAAPPDLVRPFVERLLQCVEARINHSDQRLATAMLTVLGELAESLGTSISMHLEALLPVLVDMIQKQSAASTRREVIYRALGKICQGGGFVSEPFVRYPTMLTTLLHVIRSDPDKGVREEVLRLIGIVGALDPEMYNEKRQETSKLETKADFSEVAFTSSNFSPEFYSRIAVSALTHILKDSQAPILQKTVVQALVTIFRSLGARKTISYLREVIPLLLALLRQKDSSVADFILQELGSLVAQTGLFFGPFVEEMLELLFPMWGTESFPLALVLIQQVAASFGDEFSRYVPMLFPRLYAVLRDEHAPPAHRQAVLALLLSFKFSLLHYTHFLAPTLAELILVPDMVHSAIHALVSFVQYVDFSLYLPSIVRSLVQILDDSSLQELAVQALMVLGDRSGYDFAPMVPLVDDALRLQGLNAPDYHMVIARAVSRTVFLPNLPVTGMGVASPAAQQDASTPGNNKSNTSNLGSNLSANTSTPTTTTTTTTTGNNNNNNNSFKADDGFGDGRNFENKGAVAGNSVDFGGDDDVATSSGGDSGRPESSGALLSLNIRNLASVWSISQVSTPQDWFEWLRRFVVTLLVESPSPAFRACLNVAQIHYPLARQLFNTAFASVWRELPPPGKVKLVEALQAALNSPTIPPEILQTLLDLVEYMETDDPLPIDKMTLQNLALGSAAFAKALRYAEENYRSNPEPNVERMISLYTQLRIPSAAIGVLAHARARFQIELDESWMERLQRWDTALEMYEEKARADPKALEPVMGRLRCLKALGEWELLSRAADEAWERGSVEVHVQVAPFAAGAAHNIRDWKLLDKYLHAIPPSDEDGNFYRAISCVSRGSWSDARSFIIEARKQADVEMTALVAESYVRAYSAAVRLQQLVELEEIIAVRTLEAQSPQDAAQVRAAVSQRWNKRFVSMAHQADFMRRVLGVRALLFAPSEQINSWLLYASVCARTNRMRSSRRAIAQLIGRNFETVAEIEAAVPDVFDSLKARPFVGAFKYLWRSGKRLEAITGLDALVRKITSSAASSSRKGSALNAAAAAAVALSGASVSGIMPSSFADPSLSKMFLRLASWQRALLPGNLDEGTLRKVADSCRMAIHFDSTYKSWHLWSLTNFETIQYYERYGSDKVRPYLQPAIEGFFQAIGFAESATLCFPDVLRVLTLWFRHAAVPEVEESLREGFRRVSLDTWIVVIPQLLARIHSPVTVVRRLVHDLLVQLAEVHPQALVYPVGVASKSLIQARQQAALGVLARMRTHSPRLVEQALMVRDELIGASVVLHEMWYEALEDAAGLFYSNENIPGMLKRLAPLHANLMQSVMETRHQISFQQEFGADLQEAYGLCENYKMSRDMVDLNDAWECYARVYYKLKKRIPKLRKLQLEHVSPLLANARDLELAVPGTYAPNTPIIRIQSFQNQLRVYNTKQRPRKLNILGSDGNLYVYILKAHEDLRQDERVMQFFSLANSLLSKRIETKALNIETYPIIPLSPNSGLIGFVPHSDTIHQLITDYRLSVNIPLDIEFQLLYEHVEKSWTNYHILTTMQKVHVFRHICKKTSGQELARVMWIRAGSSERWLDNRAIFTNSFAVMSIVGYILGLGDRHPNNIVIDRVTGKLIHIDFGDCKRTKKTFLEKKKKKKNLLLFLQQVLRLVSIAKSFRKRFLFVALEC